MSTLYWLTSLASLLGVWLNIRKDPRCWLCWIVTNTTWTVADLRHGLPQQAVLQAVYLGLSFWGLWSWRAVPRRVAPDTAQPGR